MSDLILHELTASPNNVKVRVALGHKGLAYDRKPLSIEGYPGDRSSVIALSGQPRLPVLQHGQATVFDSGAILRYLDANFRDTPALFSSDFTALGEIETWEQYGKSDISPAIGLLFGQLFAPEKDPAAIAQANQMFHAATASIEERLGASEYLVGDTLTAADVVLAPAVHLGCLNDGFKALSPLLDAFSQMLGMGEGRDRTRAWVHRVLSNDAVYAEAAGA